MLKKLFELISDMDPVKVQQLISLLVALFASKGAEPTFAATSESEEFVKKCEECGCNADDARQLAAFAQNAE